MNISREVKVGVLGLVALVLLYFGFNFLKGSDILSSTKEYKVTYQDVMGLEVSNTVKFKGVVVGRVIKIIPNYEKDNVDVLITVKKNVAVTDQSIAELSDDGLLGGKLINLIIKPGNSLAPESNLQSSVKLGLMDTVADKIDPALKNVDSLMRTLNVVIKEYEHSGEALKGLIAGATQTTAGVNGMLTANSKNLNVVTTNAATLTQQLNSVVGNLESQLKPILANTTSFTDSLKIIEIASTVQSLNHTISELQGVVREINNGEGTIGKLAANDSLYNNLNYTAESLNRLLVDFKESPKRYVHFSLFGRKDKKAQK